MNELILSVVLDGMMVALLAATVVICFRLNGRIRVLQDSKSDFSQLITRFDETTRKAQDSIKELQEVSKKVNDHLSGRLDKANFLADDLAFMIEKGNKLADQMEGNLSSRKPEVRLAPAAPSAPISPRNDKLPPVTEDALSKTKSKRGIEAMLNKVSGRKEPAADTGQKRRSKAEQELYDALKSGE